jgi:DNA-binding NarL/FixJ family response regulator
VTIRVLLVDDHPVVRFGLRSLLDAEDDLEVVGEAGDGDILRAVEAGAKGYLLKDTPRDVLSDAVRAAARGETVLAPPVAARLMRRLRAPASESLTPREVEVLQAVALGRTNAQIGRELSIGEATVKTHLIRAFAKLGVDDRTHAVTVAMRRGLLGPSDGRPG